MAQRFAANRAAHCPRSGSVRDGRTVSEETSERSRIFKLKNASYIDIDCHFFAVIDLIWGNWGPESESMKGDVCTVEPRLSQPFRVVKARY